MRVHRNCCGLDVHKQTIAACLISENEDGTSSRQKRIFGTMTQQLRELAQWLAEAKVTAVAMSSKKKAKPMTVAEMARLGGQATAKKLTAEQRKEAARKAARARWAKQKKGKR